MCEEFECTHRTEIIEQMGDCECRQEHEELKRFLEELQRYRDTGLTPEQIREMQELLSRENGKETTRSSRDDDVTEYCPHCDREIAISWNVEQDGYQIFCPNCGETIMLCSMCDREPCCDWTENGCTYSDDRYGKRKEQK